MSSKEKRKSSFFGFGSIGSSGKASTASGVSNASKHRTIVLPKENDLNVNDLPKRRNTMDLGKNIPQPPSQRLSMDISPPAPQARSRNPTPGASSGATATTNTTQADSMNPNTNMTTEQTRVTHLDAAKVMHSDLSAQRSNSSGISSKRASLIRKPPPPLMKSKSQLSTEVIIPHEENKPELNKLITSLEEDVSEFNPTSAVSPVPSSVYSPFASTEAVPASATSTVTPIAAAKSPLSSDGTASPGNFDEEFRKIEELLNQSSELNHQVDTHLSHSRHASNDYAQIKEDQSIAIQQDKKPVHEFHMTVVEESGASAETTNDDALQAILQVGAPPNPMGTPMLDQGNSTDDEFYDAVDVAKQSVQSLTHGQNEVFVTPQIITESTFPSPDSINERQSTQQDDFADIPNADVDVSSPEETPEAAAWSDQRVVQPPRSVKYKSSMDVINGHPSESSHYNDSSLTENIPYDYEGNDYLLSEPEEADEEQFDRNDANDYSGDDDEKGNDLQDRYISQQEQFYHKQDAISSHSYLEKSASSSSDSRFNSKLATNPSNPAQASDREVRPVEHNVVSPFADSSPSRSSDEDDNEDDKLEQGSIGSQNNEEKLSFTARSPFYSPFEPVDDNQPRRMIITNNVSDEEEEEEEKQDAAADRTLQEASTKRNSYFGNLDLESYVAKENAKYDQQQATTLQVPGADGRSGSPAITPSEGQTLSHLYDRREEATVVPVAYSNATSSTLNPVTSPDEHIPETTSNRRRPLPDFPVTGRSGRSLSVNQEQQPVFIDTAPVSDPVMMESNIGPKDIGDFSLPSDVPVDKLPMEKKGEKSAYVMALRRKAGTSYSDVGPPHWTLPIAIRSPSEKAKTQKTGKYSGTTMSFFKKGVLSNSDIKHGNLRPRLLASEVDDDEIDNAAAATAAMTASTARNSMSTTDTGGSASLAHTNLGAMIAPNNRGSMELYQVRSGSNSLFSGASNNSGMNNAATKSPYLDENTNDSSLLNDLHRAGSIKSYAPESNNNGKLKLFIANPDNGSDSE